MVLVDWPKITDIVLLVDRNNHIQGLLCDTSTPAAVIELTFNPTQYSVSEGDRDVVLTLLASQPASFDYTVHVDTVNGTAVGQLF